MKRGVFLKIALDAQLLLADEKTGIGWCAENILTRIPQIQDNLSLNCFTLGYNDERLYNIMKYKKQGYNIESCSWFHGILYRMISSILPIPYSLFFNKKMDITVFFSYIIPPFVNGRKVVFVYDMAYKTYPETVRKRTREILNIALRKSCKRADKIITISEFSKAEIIRYLNIEENKIIVMPCGVDFSKFHNNYSSDIVKTVKDKYHIKRDYLLYLGTLEPRKNIIRLILAYSLLKESVIDIPLLVIAGKKGWMYDEIFKVVRDYGLENDVIFTGYLETEEAPIIMNGAHAFLFPSIYEGFGLPPLEAMACGTPVLVSDAASLPEVVGDAGMVVNPNSVESIKQGIEILLRDNDLRDDLIKKGLERVKQFTWDKSVEILLDVMHDLNKEERACEL